MWGFFGICFVWPLVCLVVCGPIVLLSAKFSTRAEWEQTTEPGKYDDRPPPVWHGFVKGALIVLAFLIGYVSLPWAIRVTSGW